MSKKPNFRERIKIHQCEKLVNKHKSTFHIVKIYGQMFVIPTKVFQESIEKNLCLDIVLYKTQKYYDIAKGKVKGHREYKQKNTSLSRLIKNAKDLIKKREIADIDSSIFKELTKEIKQNIKQIKKSANSG